MRATITLSKTDFYIIDHAVRVYMAREENGAADLAKEENLLDRVNDKIYEINRREKAEKENH